MNLLPYIYPRSLQERIYNHLFSRYGRWPKPKRGTYPLAFAPTSLTDLLHSDCSHRQIAWLGFYELALSRKISRLANTGGILIDVGANVGYYTCLWAAHNKNNVVMAFEASPRPFKMLEDNVVAAALADQTKLFHFALGHVAGSMRFDLGPDDQSGWGGLILPGKESKNTIDVQVRRLDEVVTDKHISALKIDTEGADYWVLRGAEALLAAKRIDNIFFEVNEVRMKELGIRRDAAKDFLSELGYEVFPLSRTEFQAVPKAGA